jgi:hypothetical protein
MIVMQEKGSRFPSQLPILLIREVVWTLESLEISPQNEVIAGILCFIEIDVS